MPPACYRLLKKVKIHQKRVLGPYSLMSYQPVKQNNINDGNENKFHKK